MGAPDRLGDLINRAVEEEGYEPVHHEFLTTGGQPVLRIYIDKPGGVTLDDCQYISEKLSVLLDVEDIIPHRYTLEVSSPGLDRPLVKERDFVRFLGKRVRLKTREAIGGQRNFKGTMQRFERRKMALLEDGKMAPVEIDLENIQKANLIYEFKDEG
ncbi:MAG TPA: ribosome maturation factor RimP [Acidobacteriota bacterium]